MVLIKKDSITNLWGAHSEWIGWRSFPRKFLAWILKIQRRNISICEKVLMSYLNWAAAKTQISLGIHPVWSVIAVRMKKPWVLSYPLSAQRRLRSDWAEAQADRFTGRMSFVGLSCDSSTNMIMIMAQSEHKKLKMQTLQRCVIKLNESIMSNNSTDRFIFCLLLMYLTFRFSRLQIYDWLLKAFMVYTRHLIACQLITVPFFWQN